jgi:pimeloyl-ACP methyl ester carboxylesterase
MNLVLIRGLTRESRHWGDIAGAEGLLARQLRQLQPGIDWQVLSLDLPGNGRFSAMQSPASVAATVELARAQLLAIGAAPPYVLIGMSLGGMVATDWAQRYPQEARRLILINSSMRPFNGPLRRLRPRNWPSLLRLAAVWTHPAQSARIERQIHALTCRRTDSLDADVNAWVRIREDQPVSASNALRQLWAAICFRCADLPPACRTLLLSGAHDGLVHPDCSVRLATLWRAGHYQHPTAGHDLPHDDPGWLSARIAGWLTQA